MLNAHCTRQNATLYFTLAIAATVESLVTDIVTFKRSALLSQSCWSSG